MTRIESVLLNTIDEKIYSFY